MRNVTKCLSVVLFTVILAVGCGQKGPLFLPDDPSTISTSMPSRSEAQPMSELPEKPDDDENEDDKDDQ